MPKVVADIVKKVIRKYILEGKSVCAICRKHQVSIGFASKIRQKMDESVPRNKQNSVPPTKRNQTENRLKVNYQAK